MFNWMGLAIQQCSHTSKQHIALEKIHVDFSLTFFKNGKQIWKGQNSLEKDNF